MMVRTENTDLFSHVGKLTDSRRKEKEGNETMEKDNLRVDGKESSDLKYRDTRSSNPLQGFQNALEYCDVEMHISTNS